MTSLFDNRWISIVFKDRNQKYGAYELRQLTEKNILIAAIISVTLFGVALASPIIIRAFGSNEAEEKKVRIIENVELLAPPPIDPTAPPPPPPPPPPPLKTTIKFTPPKIVKDEEVTEEDEPPTQDELKEADAGAETQEGDTSGVDLSLLDVSGNEVVGDEAPSEVFTIVEQMPEFPGGEKALLLFIRDNVQYPSMAKENDIEGTVYVRFVIERDGSVQGAEVAKGADKMLNEEALRVVRAMPKWKPGKQRGIEVRVQYIVPIKFILQ